MYSGLTLLCAFIVPEKVSSRNEVLVKMLVAVDINVKSIIEEFICLQKLRVFFFRARAPSKYFLL